MQNPENSYPRSKLVGHYGIFSFGPGFAYIVGTHAASCGVRHGVQAE
jgi:hypothetical protein